MSASSTESRSDKKQNAVNEADLVMTEGEKRLLALKPASRPSFWTTRDLYSPHPGSEHERHWQKKLIGKRLLMRGRDGVLEDIRYWIRATQSELAEARQTGPPEEIQRAQRRLEEQIELKRTAPLDPPEWDVDYTEIPEWWELSGTGTDAVEPNRILVILDGQEFARFGSSIITLVYAG